MLFSSLTFLFLFLPFVIFIYFLAKDKYKNIVLLIFSLLFYSWGEPKYIFFMILSIIINYELALFIDKYRNRKRKKLFFLFSIIFNIGLLFIFKYASFFTTNINQLFKINLPIFSFSLPIGISFYTFQILSYVIDVYRNDVKVQKNILILGTYISLFPQLIAGPIVRYSTIEQQLSKREHSFSLFCDGLRRFFVGLIKKVLIANNVAIIADTILDSPNVYSYHFVILLIALLSYTIQIYYDFSGYSDMAIGLGKIFGFQFLENFHYPYAAISITDFWRRWHISLSSWFRDYVYIPLGGNRCSKSRWIFNIVIVWLLTGIWHGANWNFILWGLYYAAILLLEKLFLQKILNRFPKIIQFIYTFSLINLGWLIFRMENFIQFKTILFNMVTLNHSSIIPFLLENSGLINSLFFLIIGLIFMFPVMQLVKKYDQNPIYGIIRDIILVSLVVLCIFSLINHSYNPFIYFRF